MHQTEAVLTFKERIQNGKGYVSFFLVKCVLLLLCYLHVTTISKIQICNFYITFYYPLHEQHLQSFLHTPWHYFHIQSFSVALRLIQPFSILLFIQFIRTLCHFQTHPYSYDWWLFFFFLIHPNRGHLNLCILRLRFVGRVLSSVQKFVVVGPIVRYCSSPIKDSVVRILAFP